jgi:hypothetical membrane protein
MAATDGRRDVVTLIGGACGIVGPAIALLMIYVSVSLSPWFSWQANALSDLGVHDVGFLFNSGLIVAGVLNVFFALGLSRKLPRGSSSLNAIGSVVLALGGGALALVGVFTENSGSIHGEAALGYFILVPAAIIIIGIGSIKKMGRFGTLSVLAGLAALASIFLTPHEGLAIPEILEALVLSAWTIGSGLWVVFSKAEPHPRS